MADHPHTIDRWDDATGENLIEQIAAVGDYLVALETYHAGGVSPVAHMPRMIIGSSRARQPYGFAR
jgi:hypothetical protein